MQLYENYIILKKYKKPFIRALLFSIGQQAGTSAHSLHLYAKLNHLFYTIKVGIWSAFGLRAALH